METNPLRQIFYHSRAATGIDIDAILSASNEITGSTVSPGCCFFSRGSFLQVLEGPETSVVAAFEENSFLIRGIPDVTVISDHVVVERDFAYWVWAAPNRVVARMIPCGGFTAPPPSFSDLHHHTSLIA